MEHMVRPVWIALAGTPVPADIKERCRQSFEHICQYFLKEVGRTFQVEELLIIETRRTAQFFQKRRRRDTSLPEDVVQICRRILGPNYYQKLSDEDIFCFNLFTFTRRRLGVDDSQALVIFVPATHKGAASGTAGAFHTYPRGYAVISANLLSNKFAGRDLPGSVYISGQNTWGSGGNAEGLIAHELGHVFGLTEHTNAGHRLMGYRDDKLATCTLSEKERWILSRSPFFTEEKL